MLSRLQEQVAGIIAGLNEAEGFALAGGAALILRGVVRRSTHGGGDGEDVCDEHDDDCDEQDGE
jgi:hypothetical protein